MLKGAKVSRLFQYRQLKTPMQASLFLPRTRTARNFVALWALSRLNENTTDGIRLGPPARQPFEPNGYPMTTRTTSLSLAAELERIASAIESDPTATSQVSLTSIAHRIAKNLGVKPDEIALMGVSNRWRHLHFLVPESLKQVGFIPLSSNSAIAARTARESRPDIINNFASVRHATVFEGVKIGGESSELIQKMISAPILSGDRVVGVIQVSRKGTNAKEAGPDFSADDLGRVLALCKPLGKLLQHIAGDS
jgi:hypothetical protein